MEMIEMFAIAYDGRVSEAVRYDSAVDAGRAVHELLDEAFGFDYADEDATAAYIAERDRYEVVEV